MKVIKIVKVLTVILCTWIGLWISGIISFIVAFLIVSPFDYSVGAGYIPNAPLFIVHSARISAAILGIAILITGTYSCFCFSKRIVFKGR